MTEEIAFENNRILNLEGLVALTLDQVILHTVVHHSSTSKHMPNVIENLKSKKLFVDGWMDVCTYICTDGHTRPALLGLLCRRVDLKTLISAPKSTSCLQQEHVGSKT